MYESEKSSVCGPTGKFSPMTCIHCGETKNVEMWAHRNGHGDLIGFVFACAACEQIVQGVTMRIYGIRGKPSRRKVTANTPGERTACTKGNNDHT